jgi:serine/threonine protein kinase
MHVFLKQIATNMLTAGTQIGSYRILSSMGGGKGELYKVMDVQTKKELTLKALPLYATCDNAARTLFKRQTIELAILSHPNILTVHDVLFEKDICYLVTESLEGQTLHSRLINSTISWHKAVEWTLKIAEGLAAAHSNGIVHGDLNPKNIYLTSDGSIKIMDFGLARLKGPRVGSVMNSIPYLSPEQIRGEDADFRSDIFSVGCVFYEMIAGRNPFARSSSTETIAAIFKEEPVKLSEWNKAIPQEIDHILSHCLEKKVASRFPSVRDLIFELQQLLDLSKAGSVLPRSRHWAAAIAAIAIVVILIYLKFCKGT